MTLSDIERAAIEAGALASAMTEVNDYGTVVYSGEYHARTWDELPPSTQAAILDKHRVLFRAAQKAYEREIGPHREYQALERAVERMGWPEIHAFYEERKKGQSLNEDAGGFAIRALGRLFGVAPKTEVETYQAAARRMIETLKQEDRDRLLPKPEGV